MCKGRPMDTGSECLHSFPPFIHFVNVGIPVLLELLWVLHVPFDDVANCLEDEGHRSGPECPEQGVRFVSLWQELVRCGNRCALL